MSFAMPIALWLLLPLAAASVLMWRGEGVAGTLLPGQWRRVVTPSLRSFLARSISGRRWGHLVLCLVILAVLTVALAGPRLDSATRPDFGNLSGRVVVFDLSRIDAIDQQRLFGHQLVEASADVPTALVAVAGDAFDVVPLTTDLGYLQRYLQVMSPDLMPVAGRAMELGLAHADSVLSSAAVIAGQVVLVTGGEPPQGAAVAPPEGVIRAVVVPDQEISKWRDYAAANRAELASMSQFAQVIQDLESHASQHGWDRLGTGNVALTPLLVGIALVLWLGLFRRRVSA